MTAAPAIHPSPLFATPIRWLARITSLGTLAVLLAFLFGEGTPTSRDLLLMAFFPFGLAAGLVLAWWRDLAGGLFALMSMIAFYVLYFAMNRDLPKGPYFAILASPAALFVIGGLFARRKR